MKTISTRAAAKKLGIHPDTLSHYVAVGKVPAPTILDVGTSKLHAWTEKEIEHVRRLLPKITNGRKTRWKKLRGKQAAPAGASQPQHAKTARAGGPVPVPHKKTKKKK